MTAQERPGSDAEEGGRQNLVGVNPKDIAESVQHLTDSILKLSTALLIVPIVFLRFVAEIVPVTHPEAMQGVSPIGFLLKTGIFVPFGLSILFGLFAKFQITHKLNSDSLGPGKPLPKLLIVPAWLSGVCFVFGLVSLILLFYKFPIEIPEPFTLGRSLLG